MTSEWFEFIPQLVEVLYLLENVYTSPKQISGCAPVIFILPLDRTITDFVVVVAKLWPAIAVLRLFQLGDIMGNGRLHVHCTQRQHVWHSTLCYVSSYLTHLHYLPLSGHETRRLHFLYRSTIPQRNINTLVNWCSIIYQTVDLVEQPDRIHLLFLMRLMPYLGTCIFIMWIQ